MTVIRAVKMWRWSFLLLCCGYLACIAQNPDIRGWLCSQNADCGAPDKFICHRQHCRQLCKSGTTCPTGESCLEQLVCLPKGDQEGALDTHRDTNADANEPLLAETPTESHTDTKKPLAEVTPETPADIPSQRECEENATSPCFTVNVAQRNKGICQDGKKTCLAGTWGPCLGENKPTKEACDALDNDCDGKTDEGCSCLAGAHRPCGESIGACKVGEQLCLPDGKWGDCKGGVLPTTEICDGKDNNCDGQVDELFGLLNQPCERGIGHCRTSGTYVCDSTTNSAKCNAKVISPTAELCNNIDDDCDGQIDNTSRAPCSIAGKQGPCTQGLTMCKGGKSECTQTHAKTAELCNNIDDDCDGQVDNIPGSAKPLTESCYSGSQKTADVGLCKGGTKTCNAGQWGSCIGEVLPARGVCDGKDNNCDGLIDNQRFRCSCAPGQVQDCGLSKGECRRGTQSCGSRSWSACTGHIEPKKEFCNNKDDDCDGLVDNNILSKVCAVAGAKGPCAQGLSRCKNGTIGCHQNTFPRVETCDGKDTNCDGKIDVCKPGEVRCNGQLVEECASDCEGWITTQKCESNTQRCLQKQCVSCACVADSTSCSPNGSQTLKCKADCSGYTITTCPPQQRCTSGKCQTCTCSPGAIRCDPSSTQTLQRCSCTTWLEYGVCKSGHKCVQKDQGAYCTQK